MKACDPDAQCGSGLECLCGICTLQCASDRVCGDDEEATCDVPAGCELSVAVCTPRETREDSTTADERKDGGKTTRDTTDTSDDDTLPDDSDVDAASDTTTGVVRVDDSDVDTVSDTTTGDGVDTNDTVTTTDNAPATTGLGTTADTNTGSNTATTGVGTTTTVIPVTDGTTTVATSPSTTGTDATQPPGELGDPACGDEACSDDGLCFEPSGQSCVCPARGELNGCDGLLFQTLALPDSLQSCVSRAVSADGSYVVGSCQVVDGPNLAVLWGPDGASMATGAAVDLTQGLGISDDGLTSYWLASDGSTIAQTAGEQALLTGNVADAFTPDGSVAVGRLDAGLGHLQAFRWTTDVGVELMQSLTETPDDGAVALSADGETAVGYASNGSAQVPVRWNASGEIEELPLLDGTTAGYANDVSEDGSVIVGSSGAGHALRWTASGVELLLEMGDVNNAANLVTRDGSRVFGYTTYGAWMWDETNGVQSLEALLGMDAAWTITHIADVSARRFDDRGFRAGRAGLFSMALVCVPRTAARAVRHT